MMKKFGVGNNYIFPCQKWPLYLKNFAFQNLLGPLSVKGLVRNQNYVTQRWHVCVLKYIIIFSGCAYNVCKILT